jgi:dihydrofolate reductase
MSTPRKLVYYVATSVDGFIARLDGSFDWCLFEGAHFADLIEEFPETFPTHFRGQLGIGVEARRFDTVLMGRATYEVGVREGITNPYAPLRQIVVSKTMEASPDAAVELFGGDPVSLVRKLKKAEGGRDIWLCGGGKLAAALAGEIDELIAKVNPAAIESGIPMFDGADCQVELDLTSARHYSNGFVLNRYSLRAKPIAGSAVLH